MQIEIPNNWDPRPYQRRAWRYLQDGGKRAVIVWHRRAGKDSMSANWTASAALSRVGTYWHMAPEAKQVRKLMWDGIDRWGRRVIDQAFPREIRKGHNDQEMKIELVNGSIWQCVGSDNYNSLVGANPVGIVFSEWSLADPRSWDFLRPILLENGGWAMFIYTPRGRNHGARLLDVARSEPGWFAEVLTVDDTGVITAEQIAAERRELARQYCDEDAEAIIQQEYYCSFDAAIRGAYYGKLIEAAEKDNRIGRVPYDPMHPVTTAWDLGIGDSTAIWFCQMIGREVRLIDYLESSGVGLDWYAKRLRELPYVYADHILPHDADVSELGTGRRRIDVLRQLGMTQARILPRAAVDDGIQAARALIPRCWFDAEKCARGLDALRQYQREWDDERQAFRPRPLHDWTSHAADAFRYLAMGAQEPARPIAGSYYPNLGLRDEPRRQSWR